MRKPIPKRIENEVLFRNQSACCVCQKGTVQIHHIDGNPANNAPSNLSVLCIEHHAAASTKSSMTKGLSPSLLRKYKAEWEGILARKRQVPARHRPSTVEEMRRVRFEIKKTSYDLVGMSAQQDIDRAFEYLYHWHLLDNATGEVLAALRHVVWLLPPKQMATLARRMREFFWHLVGPDKVAMDMSDRRHFATAFNTLRTVGLRATFETQPVAQLKAAMDGMLEVWQFASFYRAKAVKDNALSELSSLKKIWMSERLPAETVSRALRVIDSTTAKIAGREQS